MLKCRVILGDVFKIEASRTHRLFQLQFFRKFADRRNRLLLTLFSRLSVTRRYDKELMNVRPKALQNPFELFHSVSSQCLYQECAFFPYGG